MPSLPNPTVVDTVRALLNDRAPEATVCPSEVARALARSREGQDTNWRRFMPDVHDGVDLMVAESHIRLSWKGQPRPVRTGPYRLHRGPGF
jgi:hypothetical protein